MDLQATEIPVAAPTLCWLGNRLFSVNPWRQLWPSLAPAPGQQGNAPGGDWAVSSPQGDWVAVVESVGTRGWLLDADGNVHRELTRDSYHAEAYRYPITLFTLPDGRTGLAHCPELYCRLEIEVAQTGERLTSSLERAPRDIFHSRLSVDPSGRWLVSAGWLWHPWNVVFLYDVATALADPRHLDGFGLADDVTRSVLQAEQSAACIVGDDLFVATSDEEPDAEEETPVLQARSLNARSLHDHTWRWHRQLPLLAGDLLPFAGGVLALYDHPRLYSATGELLHDWPDLPTGEAVFSIVWHRHFSGLARVTVNPTGDKFAYTDGQRVVVVQAAS